MNRLVFGLFVFYASCANAEVLDVTNPTHAVLVSSAPSAGDPIELTEHPSFDCKKATTNAEKLICSHQSLAALDWDVANLYRELPHCLSKEEMEQVKGTQKQWISDRGSCAAQLKENDLRDQQEPDGRIKGITTAQKAAIHCIEGSFNTRMNELNELSNQKCFDIHASKLDPILSVYRNEKYGFEISFPKRMRVSNNFESHYHVLGGVWRQGHSGDDGIPVISVIVSRPNGESRYPDTEVRIGVHAGKTMNEACHRDDKDLVDAEVPISTKIIHGQTFQVFELSEGGMSKYMAGVSYQTFRKGNCFAIESISAVSTLPDEHDVKVKQAEGATTSRDEREIEKIINSFRFVVD